MLEQEVESIGNPQPEQTTAYQPNVTILEGQQTTREVFTGRWAVFNDPRVHPRLIPDDPVEREGLRVVLLVSTWITDNVGGYKTYALKMNHDKLMRYYYTEHGEQVYHAVWWTCSWTNKNFLLLEFYKGAD